MCFYDHRHGPRRRFGLFLLHRLPCTNSRFTGALQVLLLSNFVFQPSAGFERAPDGQASTRQAKTAYRLEKPDSLACNRVTQLRREG